MSTCTWSGRSRFCEALVDHHRFENAKRSLVEAAEVPIHGIDAGHDAARETHEERIGSERLETKDALFARDVCIKEQTQLRLHRVHHQRAALQAEEQAGELGVDPARAAEHAEARQLGDSRQQRVALALEIRAGSARRMR